MFGHWEKRPKGVSKFRHPFGPQLKVEYDNHDDNHTPALGGDENKPPPLLPRTARHNARCAARASRFGGPGDRWRCLSCFNAWARAR